MSFVDVLPRKADWSHCCPSRIRRYRLARGSGPAIF